MARTSKSPRAVLLAALATAERALPLYSHRHSPKKFTQHQLFACLVLKSFLKTDYRGVVAHLADCPSLLETLKLSTVPHYTTLQKATRRLLSAAPARRLLDATVQEHMGRKRRVRRAAIDSTGMESSAASGYFVRRRRYVGGPWKTVVYHRFPKLGVVCDVEAHFILAARESRGPAPDVASFRPLVTAAIARVGIGRIAADAGFDSEPNHTFARHDCGVRSIIPAKHGRPTTKPARGHYRRLMQTRFDLAAYRDRVQVETVISMVKRRLEAFARGRTSWSQRRELRLKVLTHNVMILLHIELFYTAFLTPFSSLWINGMSRKRIGFFFECSPEDQRAKLNNLRQSSPIPYEVEIVQYLGAGVPMGVAMLIEQDFLQNPPKTIGEAILYSDGEWIWPASLRYYVMEYHIELPQEFVAHMKGQDWRIPPHLANAPDIPEGHVEL